VVRDPESAAAQAIRTLAQKVAAAVSVRNLSQGSGQFKTDPSLTILN